MENSNNQSELTVELLKENEDLQRLNKSLIKQIKERSNAQKGQYPKKQHTGYSLISSYQKEYRYYYQDNHRVAWIYETVFQTPYDICLFHDDVKKLVIKDYLKEDNDGNNYFNILGFIYYYDEKTYPECYSDKNRETMLENYKSYYLENEGNNYLKSERIKEIEEEVEKDLFNSCYNLCLRMNGRDGYWEMSFNHVSPIKEVPDNMRFRKNEKKKKNK